MVSSRTRVVRVPDQTLSQRPEKPSGSDLHPAAWPPLGLRTAIDAGTAIQVALFDVLAALKFFSVDVVALIKGDKGQQSQPLEFNALHIDWAEPSADVEDSRPSVLIEQLGELAYAAANLSQEEYIEETVDVFCPGSVLRKVSHATGTFRLTARFADKETRQGAAKALEDSLLAELVDGRGGRRVIVPVYYDRIARVELVGLTKPDSGVEAQAHRFDLHARVLGDIDVVQLVRAPAGMLPRVKVDAGPDPD